MGLLKAVPTLHQVWNLAALNVPRANNHASSIVPTASLLAWLPGPTITILSTSTFSAISLLGQLPSSTPTATVRQQWPPRIICPSPTSRDSYSILHAREETTCRVVPRTTSLCRFCWESKEFTAGHDPREAAAEHESIITNARGSTGAGSLYRCWIDYAG